MERQTIEKIVRDLICGLLAQGGDGEEAFEETDLLGRDLGFSSLEYVRLIGLMNRQWPDSQWGLAALLSQPDGSLLSDVSVKQVMDYVELQHDRTD